MPTTKYNSIANDKSGARGKEKRISQLAQDSFDAFEPFINLCDCGISIGYGPFHLITKEDWELFRKQKAGERNLVHKDGEKFRHYQDVLRNIFSAEHVDKHIEEHQTTYFTSGKRGLGLLYLDIDAHHAWQTDEYRAKAFLEKVFPSAYFLASNRGQNGYLKIRYGRIREFNNLAGRQDVDPGNADAFKRNLNDIRPFVRAFWKEHRRFPTTQDALDWIKANNRFSGLWEQREKERANRVGQILAFTEHTFDPKKMSQGDHHPVQQYFQVVRDRFDRMGIISIFERNHRSGKAWRWEAGERFPDKDYREEQRKLRERSRLPGEAVSLGDLVGITTIVQNYKVHNTLYQVAEEISGLQEEIPEVRGPP